MFYFAKAAWLQYLDMRMVYFPLPSPETEDASQKRSSSLAAVAVDEN